MSYDPSHPWIAAARPGLHAEAFWLPGAGLAFLLPAALAMFVFLTLIRTMPLQQRGDDEFRKSVEAAIENGRRGIAPPDIPFKPPKDSSDVIVPLCAGLLGVVFCGLGILALSSGAQRLWRGAASAHWPAVEGKVLFSKVNTSRNRGPAVPSRTPILAPSSSTLTRSLAEALQQPPPLRPDRRRGRKLGGGHRRALQGWESSSGVLFPGRSGCRRARTRLQLGGPVAPRHRIGGSAVRVGGADLDRARGSQVTVRLKPRPARTVPSVPRCFRLVRGPPLDPPWNCRLPAHPRRLLILRTHPSKCRHSRRRVVIPIYAHISGPVTAFL